MRLMFGELEEPRDEARFRTTTGDVLAGVDLGIEAERAKLDSSVSLGALSCVSSCRDGAANAEGGEEEEGG